MLEKMPERNESKRSRSPKRERTDFIPGGPSRSLNTILSFLSYLWILQELDLYNQLLLFVLAWVDFCYLQTKGL